MEPVLIYFVLMVIIFFHLAVGVAFLLIAPKHLSLFLNGECLLMIINYNSTPCIAPSTLTLLTSLTTSFRSLPILRPDASVFRLLESCNYIQVLSFAL